MKYRDALMTENSQLRAKVSDRDPLAGRYGETPWRPWPPELAADRFALELARLQAASGAISSE